MIASAVIAVGGWLNHSVTGSINVGVGVFLFLSVGAAIARKRRRQIADHRLQSGLCPGCGYDIRATPDRCPECGAAPTAKECSRPRMPSVQPGRETGRGELSPHPAESPAWGTR